MSSLAAAVILASLGMQPGAAQDAQPTLFTKHVFADPQPTDPYLKDVWPGMTDNLTQRVRSVVPSFPPPGHYAPNTFWTADFEIDGRHLVLSIVDHPQAGCQASGMHHDTAPHEFSCPLRVSVREGGRYRNVAEGPACFYRGKTFATYIQSSHSFRIFSVLDGTTAPDCETIITLNDKASQ